MFSDLWPFSGALMSLCLISVKIVFLCRPTYEFKKSFISVHLIFPVEYKDLSVYMFCHYLVHYLFIKNRILD